MNKELDLEKLPAANEASIRETLTSIKGIGNWTTDIYLMFCLQAKDIFPIGDIAVVNTIKELYEVSDHKKIVAITEKWKPNRSLATYFMWHCYLERKRNR